MGYRSEVQYVLLFSTKDQLDTFKAHAALELSDFEYGKEILEQFDFREGLGGAHAYRAYMSWDDVKWYDSYEWVIKQHELMQYAADMDGCGYAFARVGEEQGDTEIDTSDNIHFYDYMDVRTMIEFV